MPIKKKGTPEKIKIIKLSDLAKIAKAITELANLEPKIIPDIKEKKGKK